MLASSTATFCHDILEQTHILLLTRLPLARPHLVINVIMGAAIV